MIDTGWLWIVFTLIASSAQVARNAMQRELTTSLGTAGATHVRFLFGLPFAFVLLGTVLVATREPLPATDMSFWGWLVLGALTQIGGTALMLMAMRERSFLAATAYIKTEPIQVAIFGSIFLGDTLSLLAVLAIVIATGGVMLTVGGRGAGLRGSGLRPTALGLGAGALFALSTVGYRGAVLALSDAPFVVAATCVLVAALLVQTVVLSAWLAIREPTVLLALVRAWRPSLLAGFVGALGSQFWFLAFALTSAANVRTLALVEILFAQGVSRFMFGHRASWHESIGVVLIVLGVGLLLWQH